MKNNKVSGVRKAVVAAIVVAGTAWSGLASAGALALTVDGTSNGFTLSTFASGFSTAYCCGPIPWVGPVGAARLANGNIVVKNYGDNANYVFADVDGQTPGTALSRVVVGTHAGTGMATMNGVVYTVDSDHNAVSTVNSDGSLGSIVALVPSINGLAADTQHTALYVAGADNRVYKVDLHGSTPVVTIFASGYFADGITVSPDGQTVYVTDVSSGLIRGYRTSDGTQAFAPIPVSGGPDGVGVITGGALDGKLVVNDNDGTVKLLDVVTRSLITIADHGDRGDIVGFDTSNGTLFLTMGDSVYRLGLTDGTIGGGGTGVPEPATLGLLGLGLAGALVTRLRRRG